jgi:hypothetical protein
MASTPLSASLLKRLGEAADGYRNGREIWCVVATKFPHDLEVFFSEAEANKDCKTKAKTHAVFGPFLSGGVQKDGNASEITDITLTIKQGGKSKKIKIDPKNMDCIFWSESAVDKFVFPYYAQLYGVEHTAKMRKAITSEGGVVICGHTDGTRWINHLV